MRALLLLLAYLIPVTAAADGNMVSAPTLLNYFNNACWNGRFVGNDDTDVHCFRDMVGGKFVRDNHVVTSTRGAYGGETVFWVDDDGRLVYTYWDTHGGVSTGEMIATEKGFESPAEQYRSPDGTTITIQTRWILDPPNAYTMESVKLDGNEATRMFAIEYRRAPLDECPGPNC